MKYVVEIPIAGSFTIEVEASSKAAAIEAAHAAIESNEDRPEDIGLVEWEYLDEISSGNVCHAPCNSISATAVKPRSEGA